MVKLVKNRWVLLLACVCVGAGSAAFAPAGTLAAPGGVIVSDQNDCAIGPTNVNSLSPGQTAYVWLVFNSPTDVRGYTYEVTGTNNGFDSGILKIRFNECRKVNVNDWVAKFRTPTAPGGYTLTVFDATGAKVSSDNFTIV
jgi:hypothetical protein